MVDYSIGNSFLNALFARVSSSVAIVPLSESCYIGVSTTQPTQSEVSGAISNFTEPAASTGYRRSRLGLKNNVPTWVMDNAAKNEIKNGENFIFFDEATEGGGGFGEVGWFGLFTAETGGTPLVAGELKTPVTVEEKHVLLFRPGDLKVTME